MTVKASERLLALDVMRGITISGMIMVNNPGDWGHVYAPLRHAAWNGLTPTDLVFPFFMFIMGVSMYFSLSKYGFRLSRESVLKILRRTVVIFLVGLGLNLFSHILNHGFADWERVRILGVMQRLALAYGAGSLLGLVINHKYLLHTAAAILLGYAILLISTDSLGLNEESLVATVDRAVLGASHMYRDTMADGTRIPFDPEGLLSTLGSVGHVLLGFYVGKMIQREKRDLPSLLLHIFLFGTILTFAGLLLQYGCPINKKIWSATFVLTTCGFASLLLALLLWVIDVKRRRRWTLFFESFGVNPLYLYVQADLLGVLFGAIGLSSFLVEQVFQPAFGLYGGSLAWALFYVVANWVPGYFLYKKKVYIKI